MPYPSRHAVQPRDAEPVCLSGTKHSQDFLKTLTVESLARLSIVDNDVDQLEFSMGKETTYARLLSLD